MCVLVHLFFFLISELKELCLHFVKFFILQKDWLHFDDKWFDFPSRECQCSDGNIAQRQHTWNLEDASQPLKWPD